MNWGRIIRVVAWGVGILALIAIISGAGFVFWARDAAPPMPAAQQALTSDADVVVTETDDWIHFQPVDATRTGYIFYPGGRVTAAAYAPYARQIAAAGYPVYITKPTLNLAILETSAADAVRAAAPDVEQWVVGGHSLGGATASIYAANNTASISGLVLLASYSPESLTSSDLPVAVIYGEQDGLATVEDVESRLDLLPDDAQQTLIEGGNHAQFGHYGEQTGDNPATISREEQQAQSIQATLDLLTSVTTE